MIVDYRLFYCSFAKAFITIKNNQTPDSFQFMTFRYTNHLFLFLMLVLAAGCGNHSNTSGTKPTITVSILPQKYIVGQISGNTLNINVLIPEDANHETYEPTAKQMVETSGSHIYFKLGHLDFEKSWLSKVAETNPQMKIIDTSEGIELLTGESHNHGDHQHSGADPHIWLSVSAVRQQALNIRKGLIEAFPDDSAIFNSNYKHFLIRLDSLDFSIRQMLETLPSRSFMIYHPALGYFARDYNLNQISIEQDGKEPGTADLKNLIDLAKSEGIKTVFVSSQFSTQSAATLAAQIGARVEQFNPSAANWPENMLLIARKLAHSYQ